MLSLREKTGPVAVVVGGLLVVVGSLIPWAHVRYGPRFLGIQISQIGHVQNHVMGTELAAGKITFAVGVVLVVIGVAASFRAVREYLLDLTVIGAAAGLALIGLGVYELGRIEGTMLERFNPFRSDILIGNLRRVLTVRPGGGIDLVIAGGALAAVGCALLLRRSRTAPRESVSA